jgi:transposase
MNTIKKADFSGQDIFIGLDTHLKNWKTTIFVGQTSFKTFVQDPNALALKTYLERNFPNGNYYSAYEASFCGFKAHRDLTKLGIKNIVVNSADIPTTDKERKQKEDKRDSRKIARQLSQNDLVPIFVPDIDLEGDRTFLRYRKTLTKELTRSKLRIKSLLYYNGIDIPLQYAGQSHWSKRFISWLKELELPTDTSKLVLSEYIETMEFFKNKQYIATVEIRKLSRSDKYEENHSLLLSVPGIGCLTAMILLTEIGNISRFKNLDHLSSFVGLVPSTNSTGETERVGGITNRRNKLLRTSLIESAWVAIRTDPALMLAYQNYVKRMESQKAIIRIAKKLLSRILYVLKNKKPYIHCVTK